MSLDYGNGVTRTLDAALRQFAAVVWQADKPPLDSELNLMAQIDWDRLQSFVRSQVPSGFFLDPTQTSGDYLFNERWANLFGLSSMWANVNGWIIPVKGTAIEADDNRVRLYPPPESDARIDFVFLEAWQTLVRPNPSTLNKPSASTIWKYGNTLHGGVNLPDDLEDGEIGIETTARVQVQYRIRVHGQGVGLGAGVSLDVYPDGLNDPSVLGRGAATAPVAGLQFSNAGEDKGLWRAGDGDPSNGLGTVDGYTYAIPLCAVFRRNSGVYVAVSEAGNPNQNGGFERTPSSKLLANPLEGARELIQPTLTSNLGHNTTGVVEITGLNGSALADSQLVVGSTFLQLDGEVIGISAIDVENETITISRRGRWGTAPVGHSAGTKISFFNSRPDGKFSDQIHHHDILDLRRGVNMGDWDYQRLLTHNVAALVKGQLKSTWKKSGAGDSEGVVVHEVDYLSAVGDPPNHTEALDGPDGIRTVWSDAAVLQQDITLLLDDDATLDDNQVGLASNDQFDTNVRWDVSPDFKPVGFLNVGANPEEGMEKAWTNGSSIHLFIGGETGSEGARKTFRDGRVKGVRFATPNEMWKTGYPVVDPLSGQQHPITLRFLRSRGHEPSPPELPDSHKSTHPGPMYPWRGYNFEHPFCVLGGLLHPTAKTSLNVDSALVSGDKIEIDLGWDFDVNGGYYSKDDFGLFESDPSILTHPLLRGSTTLRDMLTSGGRDTTGASSDVYLLLYGDKDSAQNNGLFKVIGAGTVGYTNHSASNSTSVVVKPLSTDWDFDTGFVETGNVVTAELRSQHHNSDDISNFESRIADLVVVLTDIQGADEADGDYLWGKSRLLVNGYDNRLSDEVAEGRAGVLGKAVLSLSLLYHPGRGGMGRIPDDVSQISLKGPTEQSIGTYLQQSPADIDTTFSANAGTPSDETPFSSAHVQVWNRLSGMGWHAPSAPSYGGHTVGYTEIDRESQLFIDKGSKTVIFRPYRDRQMTLEAHTYSQITSLIGSLTYPNGDQKDGLQLWTDSAVGGGSGKRMGFVVPREYMPRFGRQDIPYYLDTQNGQGSFLEGVNHLFTDKPDATNPVFNIIGGGRDNTTGGNEVTTCHFVTGTPTEYGVGDTIGGAFLGTPNIEARKTTDIDPNTNQYAQDIIRYLSQVNSSDLGRGLKGIQLPPYYGISRLLGVFEKTDFLNKGGRTFKANRYQLEDDPATNLIRSDAKSMSLFIMQDGARDRTESRGDHTYIIPQHTLDLTRIPGWESGDVFEDFDYVVVCTVFGFAKHWIDGNNLVLVRKHNGQGQLRQDGMVEDNGDGEQPLHLEGVPMCIPCAAARHDQLYVAHNRTVYQGDPFMSRHGENRTTTDYALRYGQVPISGQNALRTAIQQYGSDGQFIPETINERSFEVLSSLDFYTTLGTGKIGGEMYPGTVMDVGYTEDTRSASKRMPLSPTQPGWRILPRAFSEGQKESVNRAKLSLQLKSWSLIDSEGHWSLNFRLLDGEIVKIYGSLEENRDALIARDGVETQDVFTVDANTSLLRHDFSVEWEMPEILPVYDALIKQIDVEGVKVGDTISITSPNAEVYLGRAISYAAWVAADDVVAISATVAPDFNAFDRVDDSVVRTFVPDFTGLDVVPQDATAAINGPFTWEGLRQGQAVVVHCDNDLLGVAHFRGRVTGDDTLVIEMVNPSNLTLIGLTTFTVRVAVLDEVELVTLPARDKTFQLSRFETQGSVAETVKSLATTMNAHSRLKRSVTVERRDDILDLVAVPTGAEGNQIYVWMEHESDSVVEGDVARLLVQSNNIGPVVSNPVSSYLQGGVDVPVNAGVGASQLKLTGMTERLPLGALLQDSDFLGENPLGDNSSAMKSSPANIQPIQSLLPLTEGGDEYTRFFGVPGELVGMSDGTICINNFAAYTTATPTGARRFRLYRGGGSAYVLHGENPGGPLDWVLDALRPGSVLKGGVLVCRAMLVRNYPETAFAGSPFKVSDGDEIQMVILTYGILGSGSDGVELDGVISPSGYGEGYAAADRYRISGRPMVRGRGDVVSSADVVLAVYPEQNRVKIPGGLPRGS